MAESGKGEFFGPERVLAFSDGVFAVVITLLVLDLQLPAQLAGAGNAALLGALRAMAPKLFIFALTFIIVGMSWLAHHRKFSFVRKVDGGLLRLNLLYLLTLSLLPFATSVFSQHNNRIAVVVYAAFMILNSVLSAAMSAYCLREPFLGGETLRPGVRTGMLLSPLFTSIIFLFAAMIALAGYVTLAKWSLLLIAANWTFLGSRFGGKSLKPGARSG